MNDRYSPPRSDVSDEPLSKWPPPRSVALAIRFMWASLALGIPSFLYGVGRAPGGAELTISVAIQLGLVAFAVYVILSIRRARNWARIVSLVLAVLELGLLQFGPASAEEAVIEVVCNWVAAALDVAALYLLFTPTASAWFKRTGGN